MIKKTCLKKNQEKEEDHNNQVVFIYNWNVTLC